MKTSSAAELEQTPDIAAVLAEHDQCESLVGPVGVRFSCGITYEFADGDSFAHARRAHVAAALTPVLAAAVREARRQELRQAADHLDSEGHYWSGGVARGYFAAADDLRDRADRITEPASPNPRHTRPQQAARRHDMSNEVPLPSIADAHIAGQAATGDGRVIVWAILTLADEVRMLTDEIRRGVR